MSVRPTRRLRELLAGPDLVIAPGVADALNARIVAETGFDAIYMTGAGTTAVRLGMPDVGLMTMVEMADNAGRIADASGLPLIADADTGYGGPVNVMRTVRTFEKAGVAGIHIEDQQWPKRCGHLSGKTLIPAAEMAAKIRAACDARHDDDFVIIARTDALAVDGMNAALDRAAAYEEAGADLIFVESPRNMEEISAIPRALTKPALFNMASSGKTPFLSKEEIAAEGFKLAIYPNFALLSAISAVRKTLGELKRTGTVSHIVDDIASFREFFDLMGMKQVQEMEARYGIDEATRVDY
ncbi:MAG: isocitrate lyase/PEP mutase family protein [Alphaproteobacteria bacterium]|nr:isocitrate lyase/PEP mutase family protein [Alphaproteobacteria bacterium]MDX5369806.1 isocitrate lyase/PEP mutase family protein [Alphaproteobacteria bacterium]MDX5464430.1 isocitrate lyase/PEP mutase family protein [Alphaproteobacteria bacterium]